MDEPNVNAPRSLNQPQNLSKVNRNILQSELAQYIPDLKRQPPSPNDNIDLPLNRIQSGQLAAKIQTESQQSPLSGNDKPDRNAYDSRYTQQDAAGPGISRKTNYNRSSSPQQTRSIGQQPEKPQLRPFLRDADL